MGKGAPYSYDELNNLYGHYSPSMVKSINNATFAYWRRSLYQRIASRIKAEVPNNWEGEIKDFLFKCLIIKGYVLIGNSEKLGYWFNPVSLYGLDFYYQPVKAILANPRASEYGFKNTEFELHKDGELLKFMPDYIGMSDIIGYYAEKLAGMSSSIDMAIINSKMPFILGAKNKSMAEALKKIFDKVSKGEPLIIYDKIIQNDPNDKEEPWQYLSLQDLNKNYILKDLLVDMQTIINMFDSEIGIVTVPYQKAERMVTNEADSKEEDAKARITIAIETLQSSTKKIKELFPDIKLNFTLREPTQKQEEGKKNGDSEDNSNRFV